MLYDLFVANFKSYLVNIYNISHSLHDNLYQSNFYLQFQITSSHLYFAKYHEEKTFSRFADVFLEPIDFFHFFIFMVRFRVRVLHGPATCHLFIVMDRLRFRLRVLSQNGSDAQNAFPAE